jgi:hypothetical protein
LFGLHLETVLTVSRIDINGGDLDYCLPVIPLVALKDFAPDAGIDGKSSCPRDCLARENGRLVCEHPRPAAGITDPSFDPSRLGLVGNPSS